MGIYIYIYIHIVNFNMFHGPCHSKASGPDTYNIYGCLQHLAEASLRDWWVGRACGTPFVPLSRGRLLSLAVDSILPSIGDWDISFRDLLEKCARPCIGVCISWCGYLSETHSEHMYIYIMNHYVYIST